MDRISAATITAVANTSWNTTSTWSPAQIPTATDDVIIPAGRNISGLTVNSSCNNVTVNGTLTMGINNNITLSINGTLNGSGNIIFTAGQPNNTINIAGNDNFTGFVTSTLGTIGYNGTGAQTMVTRSLNNLVISGSSTKTYSNTGIDNITISGNINISSATATFNLSAYTKDIIIKGSVSVNGTWSFGTTNTKNVTIEGNLSGSGSINMGTSPTTNTLTLRGASNAIGSFSSIIGHTVTYNRAGNQTVFGSNDYPTISFEGTGLKTATGNITCTGTAGNGPSVFSLGTLPSGSLFNPNFLCTGVHGTYATLDFGNTSAKYVDLVGGCTYGDIALTGTGIAHYIRFGDYSYPNNLFITAGSSSTVEYYGANNYGLLTTISTNYENLVISGNGVKSLSVNTRINGRTLINTGATLNVGSREARFQGGITVDGTLMDDNDLPSTGVGNYINSSNPLYVSATGKILTNNATIFYIYGSLTNDGIISIAGASTIYASNTSTWTNNNIMHLKRDVTLVSNRTLAGNRGILFGGDVSISGTSAITNNITDVTTISGDLVGLSANSRYINNTYTLYQGANIPMIPSGGLFTTVAGNTFEYGRSGQQTVAGVSYGNLVIKGGGATKSMPSNIPSITNLTITNATLNVFNTVTTPISITGNAYIAGTLRLNTGSNKVIIEGDLATNGGNGVFDFSLGTGHELLLLGVNNEMGQFPNACATCKVTLGRSGAQNFTPTPSTFGDAIPVFNVSVGGFKRILGNTLQVLSVTGSLGLYNAGIDLNTRTMVLGPTCTILPGAFSATNMITVGGTGWIRKRFTEGSSININNIVIPMGSGADYTPVYFNALSATFTNGSSGSVMFRPMPGVAPNQSDPSYSLKRHWVISTVGMTSVANATITGQYIIGADPNPTFHNIYTQAWYPNGPPWAFGGYIRTTTGLVSATFSGATNLTGTLTAGIRGAFANA
ncbi:MAG: hypothetical protein SFY32_01105, partial [Bacteroidota bacterium]|nr:hypothetical protein [Bacteroidota bacterium]